MDKMEIDVVEEEEEESEEEEEIEIRVRPKRAKVTKEVASAPAKGGADDGDSEVLRACL
jgi:hypothetical protein